MIDAGLNNALFILAEQMVDNQKMRAAYEGPHLPIHDSLSIANRTLDAQARALLAALGSDDSTAAYEWETVLSVCGYKEAP